MNSASEGRLSVRVQLSDGGHFLYRPASLGTVCDGPLATSSSVGPSSQLRIIGRVRAVTARPPEHTSEYAVMIDWFLVDPSH